MFVPKRRLNFKLPPGVISGEIELLVSTAVRTSNLGLYKLVFVIVSGNNRPVTKKNTLVIMFFVFRVRTREVLSHNVR
jgi:hypothetical protein